LIENLDFFIPPAFDVPLGGTVGILPYRLVLKKTRMVWLRHGRGLDPSMGWIGLGWVGLGWVENFPVLVGWVGLGLFTQIVIFL